METVRQAIIREMRNVAREQNRRLASLRGNTPLLDTGLDSLCFAILVVRLEDEFGVNPFDEILSSETPKTFGEFVGLYVQAVAV